MQSGRIVQELSGVVIFILWLETGDGFTEVEIRFAGAT